LYFSHRREVVRRDGLLLARTPLIQIQPGDSILERCVRFRTVGDATCTGAFESSAATVEAIIRETAVARLAERGGRGDDRRNENAMEDRKREGYF